jgi:hypothetical protein
MFKKFLLAAFAAGAVAVCAAQASAASRHSQNVWIDAHVYSVTDNSLLKDVPGSISRLPGAKLVMNGQSADGRSTAVRAWVIDKDSDTTVVNALAGFKTSEVTSIVNIVPAGKMTPLEVGTDREYIRAISFEKVPRGVDKLKIEKASVKTGYKLHATPTIRKDGIHLSLYQRVSALVGPDDGFQNFKVPGGGIIQLKRIAEQAIQFEDIAMPNKDQAIVLLQPGPVKNKYLVTVLQADLVR